MKLLTENGQRFSHVTSDIEVVKNIKEKSCNVALDFEEEIKSVYSYEYRLTDGNNIKVKAQRIKCSEMLFRPFMVGKEANDFAEICNDSIQQSDADVRKDLYNCIILSGGNTMSGGLPERFTKEIKALAPESMKEEIKVIASPERKYSAWIGGSIFSSISSFGVCGFLRVIMKNLGLIL